MSLFTVNEGDKVSVVFSPFIWKVLTLDGDHIRCRNGNGKVATFTLRDVLGVVERHH